MLPLSKNNILLRFENLADKFDGDGPEDKVIVDINLVADALLKAANHGTLPSMTFTFQEQSLTSNQPLSEMMSNKIKWKTVDDANPKYP